MKTVRIAKLNHVWLVAVVLLMTMNLSAQSPFAPTTVTVKTSTSAHATTNNAFHTNNCGTGNQDLHGQCTWYVEARLQELKALGMLSAATVNTVHNKMCPASISRHGKNWDDIIGGTWYDTNSGSLPLAQRNPGMLVIWDSGTHGHVAFVEEISADKSKYKVSEFNISLDLKYSVSGWLPFGGNDQRGLGVYPKFYALAMASPACNPPTGVSTSNFTTSGAQINWTPNSTNTQNIVLEYQPTGTSAWVVHTLPSNYSYYAVSGLNANTAYNFRLKRVCTGGSSSAYSAIGTFTTLAATCGAPSGVSQSIITSSSARVTWALSATGTQSFQLQHRPTGSTTWITSAVLPSNYTYYDITGLATSRKYEYRVQRTCTGGITSASAIGSFTTTSAVTQNGIYKLVRAGTTPAVVLDLASCGGAGSNVQVWWDLNNNCQKWVFQLQTNGTYEIKTKNNLALNLDAAGCGSYAGTNVAVWYDNDLNCQRWFLYPQADGSFEIKRQDAEHLNIDVAGCGAQGGANVHLWDDNNSNCQRWLLQFMGTNADGESGDRADMSNSDALDLNIYPNPADSQVHLDVTGLAADSKAGIQLFDVSGRLIETVFTGSTDTLNSGLDFNVSHLYAGTYILVLVSNQGQKTKRLVVAR
jgi:surface antigen